MEIFTHLKIFTIYYSIITCIILFYSPKDMARGILEATFTHSKNLAMFVFLYKSLTSLMSWLQSEKVEFHSFMAAFVGGYLVFGRYNKVNEQVSLQNKKFKRAVRCLFIFLEWMLLTNFMSRKLSQKRMHKKGWEITPKSWLNT